MTQSAQSRPPSEARARSRTESPGDPGADAGRHAGRPRDIPMRGWREVLGRVVADIGADHVSVVSAGVAFFGLLAIFPAITAVISIAGVILDPAEVAGRIEGLLAVLPDTATEMLRTQIDEVAGGSNAATGLAALAGIALAIYGAMKGVKTLMEGMNIAYDETEERGFVAQNLTALALTVALIFGVLVAFGVMMALPAVVAFVALPPWAEQTIGWAKWPVLAILTVFGLSLLYRYGPDRADPRWRWVAPGAIVAALLWILGTLAFSLYATNFGSYNETYGTLAGAIILLTWLWLSAFIVLFGAELNAELEHQTRVDTTTGAPQPMGSRGAHKADHLPGDTPEGGAGLAVGGAGRAPRRRTPERRAPASGAEMAGVLGAVALGNLIIGLLGRGRRG